MPFRIKGLMRNRYLYPRQCAIIQKHDMVDAPEDLHSEVSKLVERRPSHQLAVQAGDHVERSDNPPRESHVISQVNYFVALARTPWSHTRKIATTIRIALREKMPNTPAMKEANNSDSTIADAGSPTKRRSLSIALLRAREAVMSHFRPLLAKHDVTEQQWRVIRLLSEAGMLDASEVAERAFVLAPSLTRMIRSLEERGFITKHKDKRDGRRVLLKIAPAGLEVINHVMPENGRIYAELETRYGRDRIAELLTMLDDLAMMKADAADPAFCE